MQETITRCDWCNRKIEEPIKHGVDILRPFNPSFDQFMGIDSHKLRLPSDIEICAGCAQDVANYIKRKLIK